MRACVCVRCCLFRCGWVGGLGRGGMGGEFGACVCLFVFVSGSRLLQSAPFSRDGLFVRHRHKIIRLVVVCL